MLDIVTAPFSQDILREYRIRLYFFHHSSHHVSTAGFQYERSTTRRKALPDPKVDQQAWLSLYAPDAVVEMPNSPRPHPTKVEGLEAIGASVAGFVGSMGDDFNVQIKKIYPIDGEDAAFVEFTMTRTVTMTRKKYEQNYVSYFRAENGKIVLYREYFDSYG